MRKLSPWTLSVAAIALITSPTPSQQPTTRPSGWPPVILLGYKSVQEELKLSKKQADEGRARVQELLKAFQEGRGLKPEERQKRLQELRQKGDKIAADILQSGQAERLKQIAMQFQDDKAGAAHRQRIRELGGVPPLILLGHKSIQDELKLSKQQANKGHTAAQELLKALHDANRLKGEERKQKWHKLRTTADQTAASILLPEQIKLLNPLARELDQGLNKVLLSRLFPVEPDLSGDLFLRIDPVAGCASFLSIDHEDLKTGQFSGIYFLAPNQQIRITGTISPVIGTSGDGFPLFPIKFGTPGNDLFEGTLTDRYYEQDIQGLLLIQNRWTFVTASTICIN